MVAELNVPESPVEARRSVRSTTARGFTLVEILIVVVILGVLGAVTVFAIRGTVARTNENACATERRVLSTAAETYLTQEQVDVLPASGVGDDRYERGLVDAGFIKGTSSNWNLAENGDIIAEPAAIC